MLAKWQGLATISQQVCFIHTHRLNVYRRRIEYLSSTHIGLNIFTRSHLPRRFICQNHTAEWAYEVDRAFTIPAALCHSPQWSGIPGGGPSDRGPVLPLASVHSPRRRLQFHWKILSLLHFIILPLLFILSSGVGLS